MGKDKPEKAKDKGKGEKKEKKQKKEKVKKNKDEKKQKNEKFNKMSKEEKKSYKKGKIEKKIEKKSEVLSVDVYHPDTFKKYTEQVNNAKQQTQGDNAQIKAQALTELETAGNVIGLKVWRIEQFHIVPVPKETYGSFYSGDSYVILYTQKVNENITYDIFFWIGESSTCDEYGAAAVWTVQIDDKLGGKAVQHREVQDFESDKFLGLFSPGIRILQGGVDSAFNKVDRDAFRVRLLKVKGKKNVRITEETAVTSNLNSGDVFVLDTKDEVFQFIGKSASAFERAKGGELCTAIRNERGALPKITVIEEGKDDNDTFWEHLGGKGPIPTAEEGGDDILDQVSAQKVEKKLFRLSDSKGSLQLTPVASGKVTKSMLDTNDVFLFDTGFEIFIWIGSAASANERKASLGEAQNYLKSSGRPVFLPISKVQEKSQIATFDAAFD